MKEGKITLLSLLIFILAINTSHSQNTVYSTIAKNVNSEANSLQHNLNKAGDTLHLNSDYNLYKVEFIGSYASKVFEVERGEKRTSIPLASVPVGEYTIAAFQIEKSDDIYQYQKTIVFRISRLLPIEDLKEEELIAEVVPEIIKEEPILKEEEVVVAEVVKEKPAKKDRVKKERVKKERVKKVKVKREVKEKKTRVAKTSTPRPKKEKTVRPEKKKREVVKKEAVKKEAVKKEIIKEKKTRVAKTRTPKVKKEKAVRPEKKKREVVKKEIKKEITKEKKTRVATKTSKPKIEKTKKIITEAKPVRKTRVVETRKASLDSTEYKGYNLTNGRDGRYVVQSREEYRAENLRPNGEPYN